MPNVVAFLNARLDEEWEEAENARMGNDPEWWMPDWCTQTRLLIDVRLRRKIVELHDGIHECCPGIGNLVADPNYEEGSYGGPCETLLQLARPYATRPDFDPSWWIPTTE